MKLCEKALVLRPGSVEVSLILRETSERYRREQFEERPRDAKLLNEQATAARRQLALAREVEQARLRAEALDQARANAERQRIQRQREAAAERLVVQARLLVQTQQFAKAVNSFESAAALRPNHDSTIRELALARAKVEESRRASLAEARAAREAALRRQREQELAQARAQLEAERKRRKDAELNRQQSLEDRDRRESERLIALAQQLSAKQDYDQAVAAAQKAKRLRPTPETERLVSQLLIDLARTNAEKKGAAAKAELERQLEAERTARAAAEASAAKTQQLYERALLRGQDLLKARKFAEAEEQFQTARKIHASDAVLSGLKQVQTAQAQADAKVEAERRQEAELKRQADELKQQLGAAQAALAAKQVDTAVRLFREAKKLAPTNVEVLAGLAKAEQMRDQELAAARKESDEKAKRALFQRFLSGGKANLAAKKYEAAALAFGEALKLFPSDKEAKDGLAAANSRLVIDERSKAEMKNRATKYQELMSDGRRFLAAKQFDRALTAFREASNLSRGDKAVVEAVQEAERLKLEAEKTKAEETRKAKADERRTAEITATLARFRKAVSLGKLDEAEIAYRAAAALDARHPEVVKAQAELRKAQDAAEAARNAAMQSEQRQQEFAKFMAQAKTALQANRFDEAAKAVGSALDLAPNDKDARALQAQINQEKANAALMAQKRQQFAQLMQQGRIAMSAKKFADAVKAFETAKALFPTDATVGKALADATKALNASKAPPKPMGKPPQYTRQMDQGAALEKAGQYDRALAAYKAALQLAPDDDDADKKVDFCQFMSNGGQAMKARKFAEARTAYENALKLFPNDANAKLALQRAKTAK
jgi:tetratricopeptide (TPR) repeat protein